MTPRSTLLFALLFAVPATAAPNPVPAKSPDPPSPVKVEVSCIDDSTMKLEILDPFIVLNTKYGSLQIPVTDIKKIEFATRLPRLVEEKIADQISKLAHPDYKIREEASDELRKIGARAYPAVCKACKHSDPEVSRRADEAARFIRGKVPPMKLQIREKDVVHTADSTLTGTLATDGFKVKTFQFGEQTLKLADIASLKCAALAATSDLAAKAEAAPVNMAAFQNQFGTTKLYKVTGHVQNGTTTPSIWGTDAYTLDSNVSAAAVHAGLVLPGETKILKVTIMVSPPTYVATTRNGLSSTSYGHYPAGAFLLEAAE